MINMVISSQNTFNKDKKQDVEYFNLKHMWKHAVLTKLFDWKLFELKIMGKSPRK